MNKLRNQMQLAATMVFSLMFGIVCFAGMVDNISDTASAIESYESGTKITAEAATSRADIMATTTEQSSAVETSEYIYYGVPLSDELQEYIQDVCEEYDFNRYDIIVALIETESNFDEKAISETSDYGYMQINACNHEWLSDELGIDDFLDGEQNVVAGVYLLSDLFNKYEDAGLALMAYNCGEKGANDLWQQGIYSTAYSRAVIEAAENLEQK